MGEAPDSRAPDLVGLTAEWQRRLSNLLIIAGVLAWIPYFYLLARGGEPSTLPYLALHLMGVLPGAWLRARLTPTGTGARDFGHRRRLAARVLVTLGILVWVPYYYLERLVELEPQIGPYLTAHLIGVLGGAALRVSVEVERIRNRD